MTDFALNLISPEDEHYSGSVSMVVLPGEDGDFAAMPEHCPLITYLRPGKIDIFEKEEITLSFFVGSGFVKVENNSCLVMVDYIKNIEGLEKKNIEADIAKILEKIEKEVNELSKLKLKDQVKILEAQMEILKR